jgi:hypothetical protein
MCMSEDTSTQKILVLIYRVVNDPSELLRVRPEVARVLHTCPDIAYASKPACSCMILESHLALVKCILPYVHSTLEYGL